MTTKKWTNWTIILGLSGLGNLLNGVWMLFYPKSWYLYLPGAIPDFGPLNEHFVRDLGCMFIVWGVLLIWSSVDKKIRIPTLIALTLWYGTHAFVHVYDTARGLVKSIHWLIDIPLCYAPAIIFLGMLIALLREQAKEAKAAASASEPSEASAQ